MKHRILQILPQRLYLELRRYDFKRSRKSVFEAQQHKRHLETTDSYSFKPFDDRKAIFVHIPKCAGVSINKALFGNLAGGHTTLDEYVNIFEPERILEYFKFTIVRNPWDRLVSAYFFLKNGGFGEKDRKWAHEELGRFDTFDSFVKHWLNEENTWKWYHFRPQHHYILERKGKLELDFIGFLENLEQDFDHIKTRIGVAAALPVSNKSRHSSYTEYYTDETRKIVAKVYEKDIALLGYNFDNSSLEEQLKNRVTKSS